MEKAGWANREQYREMRSEVWLEWTNIYRQVMEMSGTRLKPLSCSGMVDEYITMLIKPFNMRQQVGANVGSGLPYTIYV